MTDSPGARLGSGVQLQPADVALVFGDGAPAAAATPHAMPHVAFPRPDARDHRATIIVSFFSFTKRDDATAGRAGGPIDFLKFLGWCEA